MPVVIVWPVPIVPTIEVSFSRIEGLPPITTCLDFNVPPFIGPNLSNGWNCTKCLGEPLYLSLFKRGDVIPLQVYLGDPNVNPDPTNPTIGFLDSTSGGVAGTDYYIKAELYDFDCTTLLFDEVDSFASDYWVGFSSRTGPLQTLFLDTSLIPINQEIFRLKLTTYNTSGVAVKETWSEVFREVKCEEPTILITATHPRVDCLKHEYLEPVANYNAFSPTLTPTPFYLSWRYGGDLIATGHTQEKELNDNEKTLSNRVRKTFELELFPIPPYAEDLLSALITGDPVSINGEVYEEFGDISKNLDNGRMFLPKVTCTQICDIDNFTCDE
jgi:hypothetical protein